MFKSYDDEKAKISQYHIKSKLIDEDKMDSILLGLLSTKFETFMGSVCFILANVKKRHFHQFCREDFIKKLLNLLEREDEFKIFNDVPILRCFYYFTDYSNPLRNDVWVLIEEKMNSLLIDENLFAKSYKIICKIFSNYFIDADDEQLIKFKSEYFNEIFRLFNENISKLQYLNESDTPNDACYICQGCLRIFSALCNRKECFEKDYPGFIDECCISPFFNELLYHNKYMRRVTIMYIYYITNWSPDDVILSLCNTDLIEKLNNFIYNKDGQKDYLSFYSILILLSFSKLHDLEVASKFEQFSPFDVNILELSKCSQTPYLHFLFHIALTNQQFAIEFFESQSLKSIINPNDDYLIGSEHIKKEKFTKYISILYKIYPDIRENIIFLFNDSNPFYFFVSFIIYNQDKKDYIFDGINILHDLLQKVDVQSDLGQFLGSKLVEKYDDITIPLQDLLEGSEEDIALEVSDLINHINSIMERITRNE